MTITSGRLGPIESRAEIRVRPLTLFVGRQGTGKSLLAQMLYFFRGLPKLVEHDLAKQLADEPEAFEPKVVIRRLINGLRSSERSFANMTHPKMTVTWEGQLAVGSLHTRRRKLGFNTQHVTRAVQPRNDLKSVVSEASRGPQPLSAVYIPAERLFYSLSRNPTSIQMISAPITLEVFGWWMERAAAIQSGWPGGRPDTEEGRKIRARMRTALGGEAVRRGQSWRWSFGDGKTQRELDIDMASSGQRANWPMLLLPQVLFSLRKDRELAEPFVIYVEEPEIHLHPEAERAVIENLVFLVNKGFQVVLTTHSLTTLYVLNNLLLSSRLKPGVGSKGVPEPSFRISPEHLAAYHCVDGQVESLQDGETGLIDEAALGRVSDDLGAEMNQLYALPRT
ncbi:MAG: AAA family ATPase [Deltaproteobacteria bacterium]|nr:AAA family ATPase [Deltaproteobacteria bacterium]